MQKIRSTAGVLIVLIVIQMLFSIMPVYGAFLESDVTVSGRNVMVSGRVVYENNTHAQNMISLQISNDTEIIYANQTMSENDGHFSFNAVMPEGLSSGVYTYQVGTDTNTGVYTGEFFYEEVLSQSAECIITGIGGDIVKAVAAANNIRDFKDKVFTVTYNPEEFEAVSLWGENMEDTVGTGRKGNVEIISYTPGKIVFEIVNTEIPDGKVWSGILNIFKFRLTDNYTAGSIITIQ